MKFVAAKPKEIRKAVDCSLEEIELAIYEVTRDADLFARFRGILGITIDEAARRLGIEPSKLQALERGELLPEHGDWERLKEMMADEKS